MTLDQSLGNKQRAFARHHADGVALASQIAASAAMRVPRASGGSRSEIKGEAKPEDIRGGGYPVALARPPQARSIARRMCGGPLA
jgi:hypothetical protein